MPKESEKLFQRLLRELRPLLKANGFRASSPNFILESDECWVIVNFQKSRWSTPDETTFYINVAAASKRWSGLDSRPLEKTPAFYGCDWRWRVEFFAPKEQRTIQQWTLRDEGSYQNTLSYLIPLFTEHVLPATKTMTTEAGLLLHSSEVEYPQLKTRTVIYASTARLEDLREAVSTLIEKFGTGAVADATRAHLSLLHENFPDEMRAVEHA